MRVERRVREEPRHRAERERHADRADEQQRLAAEPVHEGDRDQRRDDVDHAGDRADAHRVLLREADRVPQRGAVVEDDVDPDELLEDRQADADPDDRQQQALRGAQVRQPRTAVRAHGASRCPGSVAGDVAARRSASAPRAASAARPARDEVPRRLRDEERADAVDERREAPPPRTSSATRGRRTRTARPASRRRARSGR